MATTRVSLTVAEAAESVGVSAQLIRQFCKATDDTHLPARQIGRAWFIRPDELDEWQKRRPIV